MAKSVCLMAALAVALAMVPAAHAHTYFKSDLVPFGAGLQSQPGASAVLDFLTHGGEAFWTLNITGVVNATAAKIVYGNPKVFGDSVVTYLNITADGGEPLSGDADFEGIFAPENFTSSYNWTMDGLMANAGLGHLWAIITDTAPYKNTILAAPLEWYEPEGHH
ncbi:Spastin [Chlorella sorokiniana]|uniref:Spastin n=1 Tax=Chlorella sorokiniana TaxID=3076 RepID=A0A2P6TWM8_CHLSO|nr:Spastin [Chlorella sorokiniana]|eukprot:PRW58475.1 Spastin [Chlorella sorokiniana]